MKFSVVIPARNEEALLPRCLTSLQRAQKFQSAEVETIVVLNRCTDRTETIARDHGARLAREDARNLARIRNAGARLATGDTLLTIDADSQMSPNMLREVQKHLESGRYVGGGVRILPSRWSLGIVCSALMLVPVLLRHRVSAGLFWCRRADFEAIGGFDENWVSVEDLDFALRLKAHGRQTGRHYTMLWRAHITTSTRKFDRFGDWYLVRHPGMVWRIFRGNDQSAADHYFYDFKR